MSSNTNDLGLTDEEFELLANVAVVPLPGSEGWNGAYSWGEELNKQFPAEDAHDFAYACEYNTYGPVETSAVVFLKALEFGDPDGNEWRWYVELENETYWEAVGGCDYTGWDCQSFLNWTQIERMDFD